MRHAIVGLCLFAVACGQPLSPSAPSMAGVGGALTLAKGSANAEVSFTKWITEYPAMEGVTGGDVPGTFAGTVDRRVPFENNTIVQLEARYGVTGTDPAHTFVADIKGTLNNSTQKAVLTGTVTSGWNIGARVHVTFDVVVPPADTSCVPDAPVNRTCFQGTIRIMPGSAG